MRKKNNINYTMMKGTMTIETFMDLVRDALKDQLKGCTVEVQETNKNNGGIFHGIRITEPGSSIAPCIYLDKDYKDYQEGKDLIQHSVRAYREQSMRFIFLKKSREYGRNQKRATAPK